MCGSIFGCALIGAGERSIYGMQGDTTELMCGRTGGTEESDMGGRRCGDGARENEDDICADLAHCLGKAVAGGSEAPADIGWELPAEH